MRRKQFRHSRGEKMQNRPINSSSLIRASMLGGAALLAILPVAALAQSTAPADDQSREGEISTANDIVVQGQITYRNRSDEAEPILVYDADYFQRFEPLTAGDALKRVPSVSFLSDVIESDGARLRGLEPGYTQILINGEKVPGSNADRAFSSTASQPS
jgi:iron complex outermembrane recepter protein